MPGPASCLPAASLGTRRTASTPDWPSRRAGRYLLSAGWLWHPWGCLVVYDLRRALSDARVLDPVRSDVFDMRGLVGAEISGPCFSADDVVVSTSPEPNEQDGPGDLGPNMLARWSTSERRFLWRRHVGEIAGDLLAFCDGVLSLHRHPCLYDATIGELVPEWPDLNTGRADSPIVWKHAFSGPARWPSTNRTVASRSPTASASW